MFNLLLSTVFFIYKHLISLFLKESFLYIIFFYRHLHSNLYLKCLEKLIKDSIVPLTEYNVGNMDGKIYQQERKKNQRALNTIGTDNCLEMLNIFTVGRMITKAKAPKITAVICTGNMFLVYKYDLLDATNNNYCLEMLHWKHNLQESNTQNTVQDLQLQQMDWIQCAASKPSVKYTCASLMICSCCSEGSCEEWWYHKVCTWLSARNLAFTGRGLRLNHRLIF